MNDTTVYVGLDVHKDSITTAWVGHEPEAPVVDFGTWSPSNTPSAACQCPL